MSIAGNLLSGNDNLVSAGTKLLSASRPCSASCVASESHFQAMRIDFGVVSTPLSDHFGGLILRRVLRRVSISVPRNQYISINSNLVSGNGNLVSADINLLSASRSCSTSCVAPESHFQAMAIDFDVVSTPVSGHLCGLVALALG